MVQLEDEALLAVSKESAEVGEEILPRSGHLRTTTVAIKIHEPLDRDRGFFEMRQQQFGGKSKSRA